MVAIWDLEVVGDMKWHHAENGDSFTSLQADFSYKLL